MQNVAAGVVLLSLCLCGLAQAAETNLVVNGDLEKHGGKDNPAGFKLVGDVEYRYLGDERRDMSSWGVSLQSRQSKGELSTVVRDIDPAAGRWYRFTFRGLPQANFAVRNDDLYMKVAFFGQGGKVSYDAKERKLYDLVEEARRDLSVNGIRGKGGAEVWRTYQLDFMLPFPQVDQLELSIGFSHGDARDGERSLFFVDDVSLVRIPDPTGVHSTTQPTTIKPDRDLIPLGGRWFYLPKDGESQAPRTFNGSNVARLLYKDDRYSVPFAGNTAATMRTGYMDLSGDVLTKDRLLEDNVTISFDDTTMTIRSHGIPNHPTGRFPEQGFGNPSYIEEQRGTFYIPLDPRENKTKLTTAKDNSNRALHMGPIGIAINGVVFFNPFDMGNTVAVDMMDRCCGHPNQDGQYHYHKYPICVNTPWADEGQGHSPLLGWAFDGYPLYGPYEKKDVMAKDVKGDGALNAFNAHYDDDRGWHYHVTPGQFPYLIGGFWGVEDQRNARRGPGGGGGGRGPGGGPGGDRNGPPGGGGRDDRPPPPFREGRNGPRQ